MRFYDKHQLVKTHPRQTPGHRAIDPQDYPAHKTAYALRDVAYLQRLADEHGELIGRYAAALLNTDLPWTRMRQVYALLGLVKRYGTERVAPACEKALAAEIINTRGAKPATPTPAAPPPAQIIPLGRYLRPASQFAIPFTVTRRDETTTTGGDS